MTTFYEELHLIASRQYITGENKKQALLAIVDKWTEKNQIIQAALAGKINLEKLVEPIIRPNARLSLFNREHGTFDSSGFQEWSERLFRELGNILPLKKASGKGYVALWLPVKTWQFYDMRGHWSAFLSMAILALLLGIFLEDTTPVWRLFGEAFFFGIVGGSFSEMISVFLKISLHTRTRRKMARELLRQARGIDDIFREISLF